MSSNTYTFKESILRGLEKSPFLELGLSRNPFLPFIPKDEELIDMFVNRENEKRLLMRYFPELIKGFISLLILIGSKGVGKTHFLNYIYNQIKDLEKETGHEIKLLNKDNFLEFYSDYKSGDLTKPQLVLLDDTGKVWEKYKEEFVELIDANNNIKIVSVWTETKWKHIKNDSFYASLKPVSIRISSLSPEHLIEIVKTRVDVAKTGTSSPFTDDSLKCLASLSDGVPYSMVYFAEKLLHFALDNKFKTLDRKKTEEFIRTLKLKKFDISLLSPAQLRVLRVLLNINCSEKRGATSTEIAEELEVGRTGALQHLKVLVHNKGILDEKLENKKKYYYIKPILISQIEAYLLSGEES